MEPEVSAINILDELLSYLTTITREDLIGFPSGNEVKLSRTELPNPKSQDKKDKTKRNYNPYKHIGTSITKMKPQIPKGTIDIMQESKISIRDARGSVRMDIPNLFLYTHSW